MAQTDLKIGFIGTGVMGRGMVANLIRGGYTLSVYNRTRERALSLLEMGALWQDTIAELAAWSDIIITMVGFPQDVEQVYLGTGGILENARPGSIVVDMTTSKPSLARTLYLAAKEKGIASLDAPVSGGDIGARDATLSIMVGGDAEAFDRVLPVFEKMGKNIMLQGAAGSGQHTKMVNQICVATNIVGVCEALAYAKGAQLSADEVLSCISGGAAGSWQLSNNAPRIVKDDFAPGFYVKHFVKDLAIALEEAAAMKLDLPALTLAKKLYDQLLSARQGDAGTQALYKLYSGEV